MNAIARLLFTLPVRRNALPTSVRRKLRLNVETLEDRTTPSRPLPTGSASSHFAAGDENHIKVAGLKDLEVMSEAIFPSWESRCETLAPTSSRENKILMERT